MMHAFQIRFASDRGGVECSPIQANSKSLGKKQ